MCVCLLCLTSCCVSHVVLCVRHRAGCLTACCVSHCVRGTGLLDPEKDDPFELFVASTKIRYCYYKETQKILGNTYGMCVLQVTCCESQLNAVKPVNIERGVWCRESLQLLLHAAACMSVGRPAHSDSDGSLASRSTSASPDCRVRERVL